MRAVITIAIVTVAALPHATHAAEAQAQQLGSSCEASAARFVPCPKGRDTRACLLIGDNEEEKLLLYSVDAAGRVGDESRLAITSVDAGEKTPKLDDIEAIEIDGERVWVVASHSRKSWQKQCTVVGGRLAIFTGKWDPATEMKSLAGDLIRTKKKEWRDLLRGQCTDELFQLDAGDEAGRSLAAAACRLFAANDENAEHERDACDAAFNIEGAAAVPGKDGKRRLWLGLRGPTLDGKALLLRLREGDALRFDGIATVDLGDRRGVRDMAWAADRLWLLAGPIPDSTGVAFALESAAVASLESGAQLAPVVVRAVREQSEGLALASDGKSARIATDGAMGATSGAACETPSTIYEVPLD